MAGLDLSGVADVVDSWVVDLAEITRDNGTADDDLDPETGMLEPSEGDPVIYAGRAALLPGSDGGITPPDQQQISEETRSTYRMLIPFGVDVPDDIRAGDVVRWTQANTSTPDPFLLLRRFEVDDLPIVSSFHVGTIIPLVQTGLLAPPEPA